MDLYVSADLLEIGVVDDDRLEGTTERHKLRLSPSVRTPADVNEALRDRPDSGAILELTQGWPGRAHLVLAGHGLRTGRRVWFYWPAEEAIEVVTRQRLRDHWRLWATVQAYERPRAFVRRFIPRRGVPTNGARSRTMAEIVQPALTAGHHVS